MFKFRFLSESNNRRIISDFRSEEIEPHEVLLDSLAKRREAEMGISEKKFEIPILKRIFQGFFVFCLLIILILFIKTFQLQVVEGETFFQLAEDNKFIISKIQAERGVIYDSSSEQLVFNLSSFDLICQKEDLPQSDTEKERILKEISEIINQDLEELKKAVAESDSPEILISENLDHQTLILLETKIKEFPGFEVKKNITRDYKDSEVFSHVLGYTAKIKTEEFKADPAFYSINDYVGRSGIENYYEGILRKNPGN